MVTVETYVKVSIFQLTDHKKILTEEHDRKDHQPKAS